MINPIRKSAKYLCMMDILSILVFKHLDENNSTDAYKRCIDNAIQVQNA